jgi:hypothetical protein
MALVKMQARFRSKCKICGKSIDAGLTIYYDRHVRRAYCPDCGVAMRKNTAAKSGDSTPPAMPFPEFPEDAPSENKPNAPKIIHSDIFRHSQEKKFLGTCTNKQDKHVDIFETTLHKLGNGFLAKPSAHRASNIRMLDCKDYFGDSRSGWVGGTFDDLMRGVQHGANTDAHNRVLQELQPKFQKEFAPVFGIAKKRRAVRSEYDGEIIDTEHRLTDRPFTVLKKVSSSRQTLAITAWVGANGHVRAKELDKAGRIVWALVQLLESNGVACRLDIGFRTQGLCEHRETDAVLQIAAKDYDEYLSPAALGVLTSANFFRRVCLWASTMMADMINKNVHDGSGSNGNPEGLVFERDGNIHLSLGDITPDSVDEIFKKVLQAIK